MDKIQQKICDIIDAHKEEIMAFGRDIWQHGEMGYMEYRTAGKFAAEMRKHGFETEEGHAITGVKSYLKGKGAEGITVCLQGEMDALPIPNHPDVNPETGAAHACGHNAQLTGVMGAAFALSDPEVKEALDGNVVFFGIPCEEYGSGEFKKELIKKGLIEFGGGKCELIRTGSYEDIDMTVGMHSGSLKGIRLNAIPSNGTVNKTVVFKGRSSHAGAAPHHGVDALKAASIAMHALDAQRESFREADTVRVHGCVVSGGEVPNVIAEECRLQYTVRANNIPALGDVSAKVDRAMKAGAVATGCGVEIETMAGYLPVRTVSDLRAVAEALECVGGGYPIIAPRTGIAAGATDTGDVSCMMPVMRFSCGGYEGAFHSSDVKVTDEYLAYVVPAKLFALTTYNLLKNKAEYAKSVLEGYTPTYATVEDYLKQKRSMQKTEVMEPNFLPELP